jgi:hypothetical protein
MRSGNSVVRCTPVDRRTRRYEEGNPKWGSKYIHKIKEVKRRAKLIHIESASSSCLPCSVVQMAHRLQLGVCVFGNLTYTLQHRSNSDFLKIGNGKKWLRYKQKTHDPSPSLLIFYIQATYKVVT